MDFSPHGYRGVVYFFLGGEGRRGRGVMLISENAGGINHILYCIN
jgi:hypothetical protein